MLKISTNHILMLVAIVFALGLIIADNYDLDIFWKLARINHMSPIFADVRTIPDIGAFSDNIQDISVDPWGREFNYPSIWVYIVTVISLFADPYYVLGCINIIAFLTILNRSLSYFKNLQQKLIFFFLCLSPPTFLLLERGNNDGLVIAIIIIGICLLSDFFKGFLYACSVALKLFPIFGILGGSVKRTKEFWIGFILCSPILIWTASDFIGQLDRTPIGISTSFGVESTTALFCKIWTVYSSTSECSGQYVKFIYWLIFIVSAVSIYSRNHESIYEINVKLKSNDTSSELFFTFSMIFIFSLLLFGNWAYRLCLLLPVFFVTLTTLSVRNKRYSNLIYLLVIMGLITNWSPYLPKIGWFIPQFSAYIVGIILTTIIFGWLRLRIQPPTK